MELQLIANMENIQKSLSEYRQIREGAGIMFRIVIIDDEFYFRQYLKNCIEWNEIDCELVGEASDGEMGLALIEDEKPDIALIDINMPCMDGLECSRVVFEKKLATKIVILSGYSEFEYARKAMMYHVERYLLKPLDVHELSQTIMELEAEIRNQNNLQIKMEDLEKEVKRSRPLKEEKMIEKIIQGTVEEQELEPEFLECSAYLVVMIEIEDMLNLGWDRQDEKLWFFAVKNIAAEILGEELRAYFSVTDRRYLICLLGSRSEVEAMRKRTKSHVEKIVRFVCDNLSFRIIAGLGNAVEERTDIRKSYEQALFSLKNRHNDNNRRILDYENIKSSVSRNNLMNSSTRKQIMLNFRQGECEAQLELIQNIFARAKEMHLSYDMIQCHCMEMLFISMEYLEEISVPFERVWPYMESPLSELKKINSRKEAEEKILKLYKDVFLCTTESRVSGNVKRIEEIKDYIAIHYSEQEFKIMDIAQEFAMNYHYLCHNFKQQTGMTLNQYITSCRIEKAKRLIDEGCGSITLLAEKVGYGDLGYFGKCFKKQVGVSPSVYMEIVKKN
ncbi:MAG: response regulator [Oliverpabstia sp.]